MKILSTLRESIRIISMLIDFLDSKLITYILVLKLPNNLCMNNLLLLN